jgi:hypothetical protein
VRAQGEETPSELESSGDDDDEEYGEIIPSQPSPPPEDLPSLDDLFRQQAEISVSTCWAKCPRAGTRASSSPPPQSGLALVHSNM